MPTLRNVVRASALALSAGLFATTCLSFPAAAAAPVQSAAQRPAQRPMNVLLIMADDLGPRVSWTGHPEVKTPNLDRLAASGVAFANAYTQYPQCAQSRASLLTGRRPNSTRVFNLTTNFRAALPNATTLPQLFRNAGYYSARVGKIYHQGVPGGIGRDGLDDKASWDEVSNPRGRDKDAEGTTLKSLMPGTPLGNALTWLDDEGEDREQTDGMVAEKAVALLEQHKDKPFFLGVGFYRPHVPNIAPKKYFDLYPLDKIKLENFTKAELDAIPQITANRLPGNFGMSELEQRIAIQSYYATTTFMDAQAGLVLDTLQRLGLADNTIVIFLGDHGYELGEHGQWGKNNLWEGSVRTPLVIRAPGLKGRGSVVASSVELLDIYPTVAALAGVAPPKDLEGKDLAPLLANPKARWDRPAFSQLVGGRTVRSGRWRYTEWEGGAKGSALYDLATDPDEHKNLVGASAHRATVARLKALLQPMGSEPKGVLLYYDRAGQRVLRAAYGPNGTPSAAAPKICPPNDPAPECVALGTPQTGE